MTRVAPLARPWSESDAADINSWGHPDRTYEPLLLVRCLQRHPALAARLRKLGEALYIAARLPARTRTIAILRICALVRCEYQWGGQAAFWGPIAGVRDDECDALVTGDADDPRWSATERVPIDAVDEVVHRFMVVVDVARSPITSTTNSGWNCSSPYSARCAGRR
jgi:Carboxymuconolactone decarboxylase family